VGFNSSVSEEVQIRAAPFSTTKHKMNRRQFLTGLTGLVLGGCYFSDRDKSVILDEPTARPVLEEVSEKYFILRLKREIEEKFDIEIKFGNPEIHVRENPFPWEVSQCLDDLMVLHPRLERVYEGLRKHTKVIYIGDPFIRIEYPEGETAAVGGRAWHNRKDEILLGLGSHNFSTLVHEMTHAKDFTDDNIEFHAKWSAVVGERESSKGEMWTTPRGGFFRGYALRGPCQICGEAGKGVRWHEDIAVSVEEVYRGEAGSLTIANPSDRRYERKVALLREYDFISQEQFEESLTMLGKDYGGEFEPFSEGYFQRINILTK
jgi:hypothetical protein